MTQTKWPPGNPGRFTGLCLKINFLIGNHRNGVTTLKCATVHGPRFFAG